jgi:hypothetical protein
MTFSASSLADRARSPHRLRVAPALAVGAVGVEADHRHPVGRPGRFDESARRLSHEELAVATLLVAEGHDVRSVATGDCPRPDLDVCRRETEVKTLRRGASPATLCNALTRARDQGTDIIVDARESGLLPLAALQGVADFAVKANRGRIEQVRVLGAGYDRLYRSQDLDRLARLHGEPRFERALS